MQNSWKYFLFLLPILLLNPALALDLTIEEPHDEHTYTYSSNLPLEFSTNGNNGTCWYDIRSCRTTTAPPATICDHHVQVLSIPDCRDTKFSVDFDGNYTLMLFAQNDTDTINVNSTFFVDRTTEFEEGKPLLISLIIIIMFGLSCLFFWISKSLKDTTHAVVAIMAFFGVISITATITLIVVAVDEYLKFPAISRIVGTYLRAVEGVTIFLLFYGVLLLIIFLVDKFKTSNKNSKWDG